MQILNEVTLIAQYVAGGIVGLLALDNAVDMIAKLFGNKEIDTVCGKIAVSLNATLNKIKPDQKGS